MVPEAMVKIIFVYTLNRGQTCFLGAGDETQGFVHAKHTLYY
jgi:hypothetical protein